MNKQAILVVSFGTSHHDTLEKTIGAIERDLATAFPHRALHRAFTSGMILRHLARRDGIRIDNTGEALEHLWAAGCRDVLVQPTHIMNGDEYDKLMAQAAPFVGKFERLTFGAPLLTTLEDFQQTAQVLLGELPPKTEGVATLWMGHGTGHFANAAYTQLEYLFRDMGREDVVVGTVEGYPDFEAARRRLAARPEVKTVHLRPLMIVAGDHAKNDMAGGEPDSWKSMLEAAGYTVTCAVQGMGEYSGIRAILVGHALEAEAKP